MTGELTCLGRAVTGSATTGASAQRGSDLKLSQNPKYCSQLEGDLDKEDVKSFRAGLIDVIKEGWAERLPKADVLNAFHIFDRNSYRALRLCQR